MKSDLTVDQLSMEDAAHLVHPSTSLQTQRETGPRVVFTEGQGVWLRDITGREYLDAFAGMWCVNVGHGRKELAAAAAEQMGTLAFATSWWGSANPPAILLGKRLAELTPPGLAHFYFTLGGSESVEIALKTARQYWHLQGQPAKHQIIGRVYGYHGITYGAISAGGIENYKRGVGPLLPGFSQISAPYCYRCPYDKIYPGCDLDCALELGRAVDRLGPENVAAFIAEPVTGSGGVLVPPPEYWPTIRRLCDERNVLLIADEVITGFYRTGPAFAMMNWGVTPDLMTLAKGITSGYVPLGAVAIGDKVYDVLVAQGSTFDHGFTYSGHPVCCAVALQNLAILTGEKLGDNARETGAYLLHRLAELRELPYVGDVRGLGLMAAVELVADKATKTPFDPKQKVGVQVAAEALQRGVLLRGSGSDYIALSPPLSISKAEVDTLVQRLGQAIEAIRG